MRLAIVGVRNPESESHRLTDLALGRPGIETEWMPTPDIERDPTLSRAYEGFLISPSSPYASMEGALAAIRYARERGIPLVGT